MESNFSSLFKTKDNQCAEIAQKNEFEVENPLEISNLMLYGASYAFQVESYKKRGTFRVEKMIIDHKRKYSEIFDFLRDSLFLEEVKNEVQAEKGYSDNEYYSYLREIFRALYLSRILSNIPIINHEVSYIWRTMEKHDEYCNFCVDLAGEVIHLPFSDKDSINTNVYLGRDFVISYLILYGIDKSTLEIFPNFENKIRPSVEYYMKDFVNNSAYEELFRKLKVSDKSREVVNLMNIKFAEDNLETLPLATLYFLVEIYYFNPKRRKLSPHKKALDLKIKDEDTLKLVTIFLIHGEGLTEDYLISGLLNDNKAEQTFEKIERESSYIKVRDQRKHYIMDVITDFFSEQLDKKSE